MADQFTRMTKRELPDGWDKELPTFAPDAKGWQRVIHRPKF